VELTDDGTAEAAQGGAGSRVRTGGRGACGCHEQKSLTFLRGITGCTSTGCRQGLTTARPDYRPTDRLYLRSAGEDASAVCRLPGGAR
jgi:hypothetical protein